MRNPVTKRFHTRIASASCAIAVALAAPAALAAPEFGWTVTDAPHYGYLLGTVTIPDSGRDADTGLGGQLGFGVPVLTWMSIEANLLASEFDGDTPATDLSQWAWGFDAIANFGDREAPTPFVLFGGGEMRNNIGGDGDDTTPFLNLGGGIVGKLNTRWLRYRAEGRLLFDRFADDYQDFRIGVGLEVVLGRFRDPPVSLPPPQEIVKVVEVPAQPPSDQDGDGISDAFDRCPNTLKGVQVDGYGCVVKAQTVQLQNVTFQFNSSELTENGKSVLEPAISFLTSQPALRAEVAGHTDSVGSDAYNQKLSRQRADSVRAYLIRRGIAPDRLTSVGYGESSPIDSNATDDGRARNRRVELRILGATSP